MNLIRRAAVTDTTPQEGNLVRVKTPKFMSLVDLPANQTAFKVVRSASPQGETKVTTPVIKRTRRSEANPVLQLTFPSGVTAEDVAATLDSFGMKSYKVAETDGVYTATRADLQSIANTPVTTIKLTEEGILATVARSDTQPNPKTAIQLSSIEFDGDKFDEAGIAEWLKRNSIDSTIADDENSDKTYVVRRSAVAADEEVRRMTIEDGVTAVITRCDVCDIPSGFVEVISETAYGSWGWGQLDFNAAMADVAFSELVRDGMERLGDILRNILLWSPLGLDERKTLANNALVQFGAYVGNLMDSLPRQLLVSVVRSAQPKPEKDMTLKNASGATTNSPAADDKTPLTRSDVADIVRQAVEAAVAATKPAADPAPTPAPAAVAITVEAPLTRADFASVVADAMKPVAERLEKLEGTTIVRSAGDDPKQQSSTQVAAPVLDAKGKDVAIFRGALGLGRLRSNTAAAAE